MQDLIAQRRGAFQGAAKTLATQQLHTEGVAGRRQDLAKNGKARAVSEKVALAGLEALWRERMGLLRPGVVLAPWEIREKASMSTLLRSYGREVCETILRYVTDAPTWKDLNARLMKGKSTQPTIAWITGYHETLAAEAQARVGSAAAVAVKAEVDRWYAENPDTSMPAELAERYLNTK